MVRNSNGITISLSPRHSNYGNIMFDVKSTGPRANNVAAYLAPPANGIPSRDEEEGQWGGRRKVSCFLDEVGLIGELVVVWLFTYED
ncbi:PIN-like protein [Canna indica]|uniref:PIN-like protein n=1 Tax=Canna indica TaxID=4628 RepID=A0AAQ3QHQ9_9LILI|nr:PIN-like protein [Canna indica]